MGLGVSDFVSVTVTYMLFCQISDSKVPVSASRQVFRFTICHHFYKHKLSVSLPSVKCSAIEDSIRYQIPAWISGTQQRSNVWPVYLGGCVGISLDLTFT